MFIEFIAILLMLFGLAAVLVPKFHGGIITFLGCVLYIVGTGLWQSSTWLLSVLFGLVIIAEFSILAVGHYLTHRYKTAPAFSADAAAGNIAGIIVTDALFGLLGTAAFEAVISKTLMPRLNTIGKVFVRMAIGAVFRFVCGIVMIVLVLIYT